MLFRSRSHSEDLDKDIVSNQIPSIRIDYFRVGADRDLRCINRSEERRVGKECSEPCRSRWLRVALFSTTGRSHSEDLDKDIVSNQIPTIRIDHLRVGADIET